ncbi:uncharacterized protein [Penaeus vannamei]|uniref:uncharacterized protein isoform X1 n=1 Tax=Penaeus vannamei TaxID=6689 RepID=UPI00387F928F
MENPAFLDSDQSVYESVRGTPQAMSQRRPHHLPAIHHAHTHTPRGVGVPHHVAHVHNGRMIGVTGVPATMVVPGAVVQVSGVPAASGGTHNTLYPDPSLPPLYPAHLAPHARVAQAEPMYSCQAPRGHDHVYQCPGHRGDHFDHRDHHLDPRGDPRDRLGPRDHHLDPREHHLEPREHHLEPALDLRPDYHYGGSDYSSTEPIYAQPHLYPREAGSGTPTLGYSNTRASLRAGSAASSQLSAAGTPAKYLTHSDSCGNSTSSSTLPTVSALLAREAAHNPPTPTHTNTSSQRSSARHGKGDVASTPAKLKRQGLFRAWRVKFLRGEGGRRRACLLLAALLLVILLVLGALAAVLYITLGGNISAFVGKSPKLIEVTETGNSVVEGEFRIINQNFWRGLEDPTSDEYKAMAQSIERELDTLFLASVWSQEYNHSQVISFAEGSLLVRAKLVLNTADVAAAQKLGTAFLRGLHNRHGHEWMGQYSVDITSIRFTEVLVDTPPVSTTGTPIMTTTVREESAFSTTAEEALVAAKSTELPHLNVGWGQWGPWSTCSPCSPQYDQIRTRQCHLDAGRGLLINSIEPCLPSGLGHQLQGTGGDMETRLCQCQHDSDDEVETSTTSTTTTPVSTTVSSTTKQTSKDEETPKEEKDYETGTERLCDSCLPGEVCVGLQGEAYPTCRTARDAGDRTGCGGLCAIDSEVCRALGSRAFQCHSASLCLHDEWRCADGLCIPHIKRCDGHMNCYDQSDEQHCQCGSDQFQCGNYTSCLPITSKCDGKMDCWDGSDEANCTALCPNPDTQFTCRSSQCIPKQQFCDGLEDCRDGSDEPFGCTGQCQANEYQCGNGRCVTASAVCDGRDTCGDTSDEQNCNRPFFTLSPGTGTAFINSPNWAENSTHLPTKSQNLTVRTERIWLLHLKGINSTKVESSTAENIFTPPDARNDSDNIPRLNVSEPLHRAENNSLPKMPAPDYDLSGKNRDNHSVEHERRHENKSGVIERGWRRTAQIMPSIEDFINVFAKSKESGFMPETQT